jgi:hypothetical protein
MITKVVIGKSFGGVVRYLLDEKKKAQLLGVNGVSSSGDPKEITADFNLIRKQNRKVGNAVWHASISFAAGDNPSPQQMQEIAKEYVREMGLSKGQFLVVRHQDTNHAHMHILANRVGYDGKTVSDSLCARRGMSFSKKMEKQYGFAVAKDKPNKQKQAILKAVDEGIALGRGFAAIEADLRSKGWETVRNEASTGKVTGIRFTNIKRPDLSFKGSDLGKAYSWANIQKRIEQQQAQSQAQVTQKQAPKIIQKWFKPKGKGKDRGMSM